jgi:hypothetical protein
LEDACVDLNIAISQISGLNINRYKFMPVISVFVDHPIPNSLKLLGEIYEYIGGYTRLVCST